MQHSSYPSSTLISLVYKPRVIAMAIAFGFRLLAAGLASAVAPATDVVRIAHSHAPFRALISPCAVQSAFLIAEAD